ncbi:heme oxygenase-like protein [Decorospora gaudefroyi]|uniref:Heme oxygenase-like protein n=1 Tax=Decorospora gaudefroyi TaxID=184978 RepID=A0A6A5KAU7_9PLEO|nr:heme oxygenase-like protein [Decorospora gaudefroyi]
MLEKQHDDMREEGRGTAPTLPVSLSGEINAATRTLHTSLNRLITSRLPLALPPHTSDSTLYATGLLHFAHIFLTFESLWADILRDHASQTTHDAETASPPFSPLLSYLLVNPYDSPTLFTSTLGAPTPPSPQLAGFLQSLRPRGLVRSGRLKRDLEYLLGVHATDLEVLLAKYPGNKVAEFCTHIRKSVNEKPWTLVSYAWCFYMAIFSGGRWIRGSLLKAPPGFWPPPATQQDSPNEQPPLDPLLLLLSDRGLAFWHFNGLLDGEDIKAEFKTRLLVAENVFSPDERVDIIEEAKNIFRLCATLVDELDDMIATDLLHEEPSPTLHLPPRKPVSDKGPLSTRHVGDAAAVTKAGDHPLRSFLRRPEVTGTLVAVGCLACVALLKF